MIFYRSQVFIWAVNEFRLHQTFESLEVSDIEFIDLGITKYLAVASGLHITFTYITVTLPLYLQVYHD